MKDCFRIFLILSLLWSINLKGQDSLFFKNKKIEVVKLREISSTEVSYHKFDYLDGPIFKVEKEKLEKIRYATGLIEYLFKADEINDTLNARKISSNPAGAGLENCYRNVPINTLTYWDGMHDAERFYRGYKGAGTFSYFAGLALIYGLPVPILVSLAPPKNAQYFVPDQKLYEFNEAYAAGFNHKANKIKQSKSWSNFGYGAGTTVGVTVVMLLALFAAFSGN